MADRLGEPRDLEVDLLPQVRRAREKGAQLMGESWGTDRTTLTRLRGANQLSPPTPLRYPEVPQLGSPAGQVSSAVPLQS